MVGIGHRIGMIRRGSQVDLFVAGIHADEIAHIAVRTKVRAGETVFLS